MKIKTIEIGKTGLSTIQNGFGALPIQRVSKAYAVMLLRKALDHGMTFFDTARAYSDSEEKLGEAFFGMRDRIILATKSGAKTPEALRKELETSLRLLKTDYIDIYQPHCVPQCFRPGDGTGIYEELLKFKEEGKIRHIGITAHKIGVAEEIIDSGLYETLQYPLSYLASDRDIELVKRCEKAGMGFIAMKGLSGGLLTNAKACMAFMSRFDNVLPIWGVQREKELDEFLAFNEEQPTLEDPLLRDIIEKDRRELAQDFCRGCGYCSPCSAGIEIENCARMSQMIRRAPSAAWLTKEWQDKMHRINDCINCGNCMARCPYELNIPELLKKNLKDYDEILAGKEI